MKIVEENIKTIYLGMDTSIIITKRQKIWLKLRRLIIEKTGRYCLLYVLRAFCGCKPFQEIIKNLYIDIEMRLYFSIVKKIRIEYLTNINISSRKVGQ
jgi:hypothetical protein